MESSPLAITDSCQSLQISKEVNHSALEVPDESEDKMDYQESVNLSQLDVDQMLGSPFSDDNPSKNESDDSENDFRCKRNLLRSKKRSFVYSDTSSEEEEEDEMTIEDIEAIDDGIIDDDFNYSGLHQTLAEKDERNFYLKLERKIPSAHAMISNEPMNSIVDNQENLKKYHKYRQNFLQ